MRNTQGHCIQNRGRRFTLMPEHQTSHQTKITKPTKRSCALRKVLVAALNPLQACMVLSLAAGNAAQAQCQISSTGSCNMLNTDMPGRIQFGISGMGIQESGIVGGRFEQSNTTMQVVNDSNTRPILDKTTKMSTTNDAATITFDAFGGQCVIPTKGIPYGDCH